MLEPDSLIMWTVRLQPGDGPLRDGQYSVAIDLRKALQTAFLKPNGERWIGRAPQRTELTVQVRTPTTANDASRSEQARGRLALKERRYGDAIAAFLRAAAAGPPDVGLSADLGSESSLRGRGGRRGFLPSRLERRLRRLSEQPPHTEIQQPAGGSKQERQEQTGHYEKM